MIDPFQPLIQSMMAYLPAVIISFLVASFIFFRFFRRLVGSIISIIAGVFVFIFAIWSSIFWLPVTWLLRRLPIGLIAAVAESLLQAVGALAGRLSGNPLIAGRRLQAAEARWSPQTYEFLYKPVPEDIRCPLFEDGKIIGGYPATWLTDRYVTSGIVRGGIESAIFAFLAIFFPILIYFLWIIASAIFSSLTESLTTPAPILEAWPGLPAVTVDPSQWHFLLLKSGGLFVWYFLSKNSATLEHWALLAAGIALVLFPGFIYAWRATKGAKYQMHTKDADVRWPYRAESRYILNTTYNRQVELASNYLKDGPLFQIGVATGTLRLRGDLTAPVRGQLISIDQDALFQHLMVLGGTGEGKTSGVLRPLMRQLMPMKNFGMYVCDAKGVLWRDAQTIASETGRTPDVKIIGTGANQFGVDPIAELTPTQIVATLRSVLQQIGGNSSQSFWPDMAANILRHMFTVARSYAKTSSGLEEARKGLNPYSLWWVYQAILNEGICASAISAIRDTESDLRAAAKAAKTKSEFTRYKSDFDGLLPPDLKASVIYLEGAWAKMAKDTKSGIVANVTQLLDGFAGANVLRERFASGRPEGTIRLTEALDGSIILNALSSIEDGLPARLVIMLLKTTLYREARVRETQLKALTPSRNPQERPCIVVMDEVQEIVTADFDFGTERRDILECCSELWSGWNFRYSDDCGTRTSARTSVGRKLLATSQVEDIFSIGGSGNRRICVLVRRGI